MKAYQILLFLLIFNMFFWVVTAGLGIYETGFSTNDDFNIGEEAKNPSAIGIGFLSVFTMFGNYALDIAAFAGLLVVASTVGWVVSQQAPQGIIYGIFSWFFWSSFKNTMQVFYNMTGQNAAYGAALVIAMFSMIVGIVFVVGLMQMVTGGWKSYA